MKILSVKTKILITIVALSVMSVSIFAYFSFNLYMKDKLAYFYTSLTEQTQGKADLFRNSLTSREALMDSIISGSDLKSTSLSFNHFKFLQNRNDILGVYYFKSKESGVAPLYEAPEGRNFFSLIHAAKMGPSVVDPALGTFLLKKGITGSSDGYVAMVFKDPDLSEHIVKSADESGFFLGLANLSPSKSVATGAAFEPALSARLKSLPMSSGLFMMPFGDEEFFVSYSKLDSNNLTYIKMINKKKVYLIQETFMHQVFLFLMLVSSASLFVGTIGGRWLTWHIDELTNAAVLIEGEDFSSKVSFESKDEFGVLGSAFNSMGDKIVYLLDELRRYNSELEEMVDERTKELQKVTDIQKGMLNSLGQGFVLIDKEYHLSDIYSKAAEEMFDGRPLNLKPTDIIAVNQSEETNFKELYEMVFNGVIDFEDMAKISPDKRTNSKNQQIALNYAPIKNTESQELDYILVIGTDKTTEMESIEKFNREWKFSQMISKIAENRFSVNKVLKESFSMISQAKEALTHNNDYAPREVQRLIHTIKGGVSYFSMEDIQKMAHEIEDELNPFYNELKFSEEVSSLVSKKVEELENQLLSFVDKYNSIIQYNANNEEKMISTSVIKNFYSELKAKNPVLAQEFHETFFKESIKPYFETYPSLVKDLSIKLNKEVNIELVGLETELPEGEWGEIFSQMIHIVRNSMDHGIESPDQRELLGKNKHGQIKLQFELEKDSLHITFSDDGQGINWEKMASKNPDIQSEEDAIAMILQGGLSTKDSVSDISGRGVGVSSVYSAVQKWGGEMHVINRPSQGVTFVISLPLKKQSHLKVA